MRRAPIPRLSSVILALIAAVVLLGTPVGPTAPVEVSAATPDLTVVGDARYVVQPDKRRIRVTVDLALRNHLKDTTTRRYFFDEAFLAIPPGSSGYKLSWDGAGSPTVRASKKTKSYTLLRLDLARRLYSGKSATYRLTFNMNDPGGRATRDLRVGDSLVSFPVWAFASDSTPGATVRVTFPKGYEVEVEAGRIPEPTVDAEGRTVFSTGRLAEPLSFFAYLVADRPGAYTESRLDTEVQGRPVAFTIRSWPDDEPWADRVSGLLDSALPELGERIGLAWPHDDPLTIQEAVSRSTGGYAGLFDPADRRVEIAYYASDFVVLHEAAHGWFNGTLLADRWANEAFASYYAEQAAAALDVGTDGMALTDELRAARLPLNDWGPVGTEVAAAEDYAYAAALELANAIADRAGEDGLQAVWSDAAGSVGAYQPDRPDPATADGPETVTGPPDWRGLLDLLETHTDASFDDLWRTWVARPDDIQLLDTRAATRDRYDALLARTREWRVPRPVRDAMRAWRFEEAKALIDAAEATLTHRTAIEAAAAKSGLIAPATLKLAFEDDDGFEDAAAEAAAELEVIDRYDAAAALRPIDPSPIVALGLWGQSPEVDLDAARTAFGRGDLEGAVRASRDAATIWAGAEQLGQGRAMSLGLLLLAAIMTVVIALSLVRRRRRRGRSAIAMAHPIEVVRD